MKKTLLSIAFFAIALMAAAQTPKLQGHAVYDVNLDGKVSVGDITTMVEEVPKTTAKRKAVVGSGSVHDVLMDIYYHLSEINNSSSLGELPPEPPTITPHPFVDMGLPSGTLWATTNLGANKPENYGYHYAWGETKPQSNARYSWSSYKWMTQYMDSWEYVLKYGREDGQTAGCWYEEKVYVGTIVDGITYKNLTVLESDDDAATANWGANWCIPTTEQVEELINTNYTSSEWTEQGGQRGLLVTSLVNGNSIFLPAGGMYSEGTFSDMGEYGYYWTRELSTVSDDAMKWLIGLTDNKVENNKRCQGLCIRPVRVKK